jgi:RNA polymerase sigma factor (sigma-70 family)
MKLPENFSDIELIDRFQQGNEKAFQVLYQRHQRDIFATIVYYVKNRTLAEDLSQEVYIKIIAAIKAKRYCEDGKFLPWALRIAYNHCMDQLRKKNRTFYTPDLYDSMLGTIAEPSPEIKMVREETATVVRNLVNQLSPEQKKVVRYRYFEELSFKEIARLTNTNVNTSLGRMRYSLMHLRTMAQGHSYFC